MVSLMSSSVAVAAENKVGYVDLQKALNLSEAGKQAKEELAATVKKHEGTVETRQNELKQLKNKIEKEGRHLSEEGRSKMEREYQQKLKDFQRFTKDVQEELQEKDADFTRRILEDLFALVKEIAQKQGFSMVLEKSESSLLYADDGLDLTDELINAYNAKKK